MQGRLRPEERLPVRQADMLDSAAGRENLSTPAEAVHAHRARVARTTPYGTRVPLEVLGRPSSSGRR